MVASGAPNGRQWRVEWSVMACRVVGNGAAAGRGHHKRPVDAPRATSRRTTRDQSTHHERPVDAPQGTSQPGGIGRCDRLRAWLFVKSVTCALPTLRPSVPASLASVTTVTHARGRRPTWLWVGKSYTRARRHLRERQLLRTSD